MEKNIRMSIDLPESVHKELELLRGSKKPNAETILINWAEQQKKDRENDSK